MQITNLFRKRHLVASVVMSLALAACGGGGGSGSSPSTPVTPPVTPPQSTPPSITLVAGTLGGNGAEDGAQGRLNYPQGLALDASGTLYVVDSSNNTVRRITASGLTTLAGSPGLSGSADGLGSAARFNFPVGIAVDSAGNAYVSEAGNLTIRKITPAGLVTTLAGAPGVRGNVDGPGTVARFGRPDAIAVDAEGTLYVADTANHNIRKITPAGVVSTLAGRAGVDGGAENSGIADGPGSIARFSAPEGITVDSTGKVYVADAGNHRLRVISPAGNVSVLSGTYQEAGASDGGVSVARFQFPGALTLDRDGNLLMIDNGHVRRISIDGFVTTLSSKNSDGSEFLFANLVQGIAVDAAGNIYAPVSSSNLVVKRAPDGSVTTIAGKAPVSGFTDATGANARFNAPKAIAIDAAGNLAVFDSGNNALRRVTPAGAVTTAVSNAGETRQLEFVINAPSLSLAGDKVGNVFVADKISHLVKRLTPANTLVTVGGASWPDGTLTITGGFGLHYFVTGRSMPPAIAVDSFGNSFIIDGAWIRTVSAAGAEGVILCGNNDPYCLPQTSAESKAITIDASGNIYAITGNAIVRTKIPAIGAFAEHATVLAGDLFTAGYADGTGTAARFNGPTGITTDASGNVFVADATMVRKITPAGVVSTVVGLPGVRGVKTGDVSPTLSEMGGIVAAGDGTLYVTSENAVLRVKP